MTVTGDRQDEADPARSAVNDMLEAGLLDSVMERAAAGELALTGEGGFLREATVFGVNPLREFDDPRPAGSPFS